jgi:hypothetical protein
MMVSTPYIECYVKTSFLAGEPKYGQDETVFAVLKAIRFVRGRAPLFVIYIPSIGALYDKVDQCAIFMHAQPTQVITMHNVGWWDSVSDNWQIIQIEGLRYCTIEMKNRKGEQMKGTYLFTCDPLPEPMVDYSMATKWNEHKTKTFFFDEKTGALCSGPNNKLIIRDSSLSPDTLESPSWLKVYKEDFHRLSLEDDTSFGDTEGWFYE